MVLFPAAHTPIRACDRSRSSNLINAISVEEELGVRPNLRRRCSGICASPDRNILSLLWRVRARLQQGTVFRSVHCVGRAFARLHASAEARGGEDRHHSGTIQRYEMSDGQSWVFASGLTSRC